MRCSVAPADRLPPAVETAAYFVVAEALTNVARYAGDAERDAGELPGRRDLREHDDADDRRGRGSRETISA